MQRTLNSSSFCVIAASLSVCCCTLLVAGDTAGRVLMGDAVGLRAGLRDLVSLPLFISLMTPAPRGVPHKAGCVAGGAGIGVAGAEAGAFGAAGAGKALP
eukprot:scaffold3178_cov282-Pinguiococcus_pyrenoidosus.AAC.10